MADLAENAASSLLGIVDPMIGGKVSGIHAIVHGKRFVDGGQKILQLHGHGREAAIEADHQQGSGAGSDPAAKAHDDRC